MSYELTRQETLILVYEVTGADVTLTGAEPVSCHLKRKGSSGRPVTGAPALIMTHVFTAASGGSPDKWTFTGSTAGIESGTYLADAFVTIGGNPVLLFNCEIVIEQNVTVI